MPFVIYNTRTLKRMAAPRSRQQTFELERTAKRIRTLVLKQLNLSNEEAAEWVTGTVAEWESADFLVSVKSAMTGSSVAIKASQRGNPAVDPSMEGYWTM